MYSYRLTEEIARWAFEIICRGTSDWYIAFTNPTAGPWKSVKSRAADGTEGEIYRFGSNEERPNIVLVNDRLGIIIIIEAKDFLENLTAGRQISKSVQVVSDMSGILHGLRNNKFWQTRWQYKIITGLLWGADYYSSMGRAADTFALYIKEISSRTGLDGTAIIGIETLRDWDDSLRCSMLCHPDEKSVLTESLAMSIADSLHLPLSLC